MRIDDENNTAAGDESVESEGDANLHSIAVIGLPRSARNVEKVFEQAYRELRPRAPLPQFSIQFFPSATLNNPTRLREGRLLVRFSDLLEGAPESVLHAILHILIAKLYRKEIDGAQAVRFRKFAGSKDLVARMNLIRQMRGRKRLLGSKGKHFDLEQIFEELNTR